MLDFHILVLLEVTPSNHATERTKHQGFMVSVSTCEKNFGGRIFM
jgi:hypothetical protein